MRIRIGDLLVKAGVITDAQLKQALAEQHQWGGKLGDILVRMAFVTEDVLVRALAKQSGIPRADLVGEAPKAALERVSAETAEEFGLVPLALQDDGRTLVVAMSDPLNIMVTDHLRSITGCRVVAQIAGTTAIRDAIQHWYRGQPIGNDAQIANIRITDNGGSSVAVSGTANSNPPLAPRATPPGVAISSSGLRAIAPNATATPQFSTPPPVRPPSKPELPTAASAPALAPASAVEVLRSLEETQRRSVSALKAMVELLIEKGVFSRDEYLGRVKR
jgi:hypothetical protein